MGSLTENGELFGSLSLKFSFPNRNSSTSGCYLERPPKKKARLSSMLQDLLKLSQASSSQKTRNLTFPSPMPFSRPVHAPQRSSKFSLSKNSDKKSPRRVSSSSEKEDSGKMESIIRLYREAKRDALRTITSFTKEEISMYAGSDLSDSEMGDKLSLSAYKKLVQAEESHMVASHQSFEAGRSSKLACSSIQPTSSEDLIILTPQKQSMEKPRDPQLLFIDFSGTKTNPLLCETLLEASRSRDSKLNSIEFLLKHYEETLASALKVVGKRALDQMPRIRFNQELFTPLTDKDEEAVARGLSDSNPCEVLVSHESSNIEITRRILHCLKPDAWLNDEVINLYLYLLKERERNNPRKFLKCHFFNTFFYKKLTSGRHCYDYKAVRRWTNKNKIGYSLTDCDKIFVPIHREIHWCLAVINLKDENFQYLDSLGGHDPYVMEALANYLVDEAKDKSNKVITVSSWQREYVKDCPEQQNSWDCGMFMIKYVDFYSRGLSLCFNQDDIPYFRRRTAKEILNLKAD